jgi:hypothetical protein
MNARVFTAFVLSIALGHAALAGTGNAQQQLPAAETLYDAQKDVTTVRLPLMRISGDKDRYHSLDFSVYYNYAGKTKQLPGQVNFELVSVVKARKLNSDLYVVFVVDGEEMHFGSSRAAIMRPVPGRLWIGERMIFTMPVEKFRKLGSAKELTIKMGAVVFTFSDESRAALRSFADSINWF